VMTTMRSRSRFMSGLTAELVMPHTQ
jgi:hypothetical protein